MLVAGAMFWQYILALHIFAVVVAFGVIFLYPLFGLIGLKLEARAMPSFHRFQHAVHMKVSSPGLVVIMAAGIYLASHLHVWSHFFVQWGLGASIVIGGIGGGYLSPRERKLAALAEAEVAGVAGGADVTWSAEYQAVHRQAEIARGIQGLIAFLTILFMTLHTG